MAEDAIDSANKSQSTDINSEHTVMILDINWIGRLNPIRFINYIKKHSRIDNCTINNFPETY